MLGMINDYAFFIESSSEFFYLKLIDFHLQVYNEKLEFPIRNYFLR
jgi:hypothetical protein